MSIKCQEIVKNDVLNCLVYTKNTKDIQFTVTQVEWNQKTFRFKELEPENFDFFPLKTKRLEPVYESIKRFIKWVTTNQSLK